MAKVKSPPFNLISNFLLKAMQILVFIRYLSGVKDIGEMIYLDIH